MKPNITTVPQLVIENEQFMPSDSAYVNNLCHSLVKILINICSASLKIRKELVIVRAVE